MKKALHLIVSYYKSNRLLNHGFPTYEPTNLVQPISTKTSFVSLCSVATLKPSLSNRFGKPTNEIIKPFHFHFIDYKMKNLSVFFKKKLDGPDLSSLGQLSIRTGTTICKRNGEWIEDVQWRAIPASTRVLQAFFLRFGPPVFSCDRCQQQDTLLTVLPSKKRRDGVAFKAPSVLFSCFWRLQ